MKVSNKIKKQELHREVYMGNENKIQKYLSKGWKKFLVFSFGFVMIIAFRILVGEICTVPSNSMEPTIMTGDWLWINKAAYGARLPARFADIPLINVFTWNKSWREADSIRDWGYHRFLKLRAPKVNDVIVFNSITHPDELLVKRVSEVLAKNRAVEVSVENIEFVKKMAEMDGVYVEIADDSLYIQGIYSRFYMPKQNFYYVLGDNATNSMDSRFYGYIPESAVLGKMGRVLISVDNLRKGWGKIRWSRILKAVK